MLVPHVSRAVRSTSSIELLHTVHMAFRIKLIMHCENNQEVIEWSLDSTYRIHGILMNVVITVMMICVMQHVSISQRCLGIMTLRSTVPWHVVVLYCFKYIWRQIHAITVVPCLAFGTLHHLPAVIR